MLAIFIWSSYSKLREARNTEQRERRLGIAITYEYF